MNSCQNKSLTLIELIIALVLMGLIVLGFSSVDLFSRYQVMASDRRAKLQNEVSYALEHMSKETGKAIGSRVISGQDPIDLASIAGDTAIRVYVDVANDGVSPGDGQRGTGGDRWRAYRYRDAGAPQNDRYQIWYYPDYSNPNSPHEVIARKISAFTRSVTDNYVFAKISACWDTDGSPLACGTIDNPSITMQSCIQMPAVSTN